MRCFILFQVFPLLFVFAVGGLGFEFCVFIASWRLWHFGVSGLLLFKYIKVEGACFVWPLT